MSKELAVLKKVGRMSPGVSSGRVTTTVRDMSGRVERQCFEEACRLLLGSPDGYGIERALVKKYGPLVVRDMLVTYQSGDYDLFGRKFEGNVFEAELVTPKPEPVGALMSGLPEGMLTRFWRFLRKALRRH